MKQHNKCLIAFIILVFISVCTAAQKTQLNFHLVNGINGVFIGKITGITQDKAGYMWFMDQINNRLIRYDGYRMKIFRNDPSDTTSLGVGNFECVAADSSGGILVSVKNGIDRYDPLTGKFTHYPYPVNQARNISNILVDHSGIVWVGTDKGLDRLDLETGIFINYPHRNNDPNSLSCNIVRSLYEDHTGVLWIGTGFPFNMVKEGGLNRFDRKTGTFTRYMHDPNDPTTIINDKIRAIFEDSQGRFWVGTKGDGLHIMDRKKGTFTRLTNDPHNPKKLSRPPIRKGHDADHITFITEDSAGTIWIGTYMEGLVRYNPTTNTMDHFKSEQSRLGGFADSTTWCGFVSRDGALWIAAEGPNLFRVDPLQRHIYSIITPGSVNQFFRDNEGYLWVTTDGAGLLQYDRNEHLIRQFKHDPLDSLSLLQNHVGPIFQNTKDTLWVATYAGIRKFNKATQKFYRFFNPGELKDSVYNNIVRIFRDSRGIIWFVTWGRGLIEYNPKQNTFRHFTSKPGVPTSISSDFLNTIVEERPDLFWVTGTKGVNRFDSKKGSFEHYLQDLFIGNLFKDSRGLVWAGTEKGLFTYDKKANKFIPYFDFLSPISSLPVGGFIEDNAKNLWITSFSSIIKLNPVTKQAFIYDNSFGIIPNTLAPWKSPYKNEQGKLFFGSDNGIYTFYPEKLASSTNLKLLITDLFINNRPILPGAATFLKNPEGDTSTLYLKYNQNNIAFNFAALDYRNPEAIKYTTVFENYDNVWREITGEKSSYYFNVGPGKYIYKIRAYNVDGTKAEKIINIHIYPPWWKTWWAYTLYGLLAITVIFAINRFQKQRIISRERQKVQAFELAQAKEIEMAYTELKATQAQLIQSEKMASLGELTAGIAHEIQNPLNFVNNFSEVNKEMLLEMNDEIDKGNINEAKIIASAIIDNEEKINHHGRRADSIVKAMLQHSRSSSGVKEAVAINSFVDEYLRLSYHGLRAKDKSFNATVQTDYDESIVSLEIIPQDIGRVLLNLFNNAFYAVAEKKKQTGDEYEPIINVSTKRLSSLSGDGGKIEIKVKDNGNGIPLKLMEKIFQPFFTTKPTGEGTGLGLSLSYDVVKAHGGEIKASSKEGEGTEFTVKLPFGV